MTTPTPEPDPLAAGDLVARLRAAGCVFAEEEAELLRAEVSTGSTDDGAALEALVVRRIAGEPLEQVLGWAGFGGLRVRLLPGVFVPRQRSLLLVRAAAAHLRTGGVVLDLGCGSGALGAAIAARLTGSGVETEVWATDVDPVAVACARLNLPPERVLTGDLFAPLPAGLRFDVIVANTPYVPTAEIALMPPEARNHEHRVALDGGADGLDVQRRAIADVPARLRPGGVLLVESGSRQAPLTASLMRSAGLVPDMLRDDEIGATAVRGRLLADASRSTR